MEYSLLPPNATDFEKALEQVTRSDMSSLIRYLWNAEKCPADLLYVLALTMDVDEWDEKWSPEAKVKAILDAYNVHRLRGTPNSIRRVLRNAGYEEVDIIEGLNIKRRDGTRPRNGHYFHGHPEAWAMYRIYLKKAIANSQAAQVRRLLEDTAPLHCELAGLHYKEALILRDGTIIRDGLFNRGTA